jgi:hypothetical protein
MFKFAFILYLCFIWCVPIIAIGGGILMLCGLNMAEALEDDLYHDHPGERKEK